MERINLDYNHSSLDRRQLDAYARRVAAESRRPMDQELTVKKHVQKTVRRGLFGKRIEVETVEERVVGPHWKLFSTFYRIEEVKHGDQVEYVENNYWILTSSGELCFVWKYEEYKSGPVGHRFDAETNVVPMTDERVLELDYGHPSRSQGWPRSDFYAHGDRATGRLIRHAKGVGLSLALRSLLK